MIQLAVIMYESGLRLSVLLLKVSYARTAGTCKSKFTK